MRALVTGGAGFIGSTLVDRLLAEGHEVVVVDDFSSGHEANLVAAQRSAGARLTVHRLDIRDDATTATVAAAGPEVVFHLAAQADVRVSVARPAHDASINVIGMLNVLEGAREAGARKVVFASSGGTIYGEPAPEALPVVETHPERPVSPYGVAKKVGTDYLRAYRALHGIEWTSLALANVYGPRQDPHGEAGVVAIFAGLLLAGEPCKVFGTGEQTTITSTSTTWSTPSPGRPPRVTVSCSTSAPARRPASTPSTPPWPPPPVSTPRRPTPPPAPASWTAPV